MGKDATYCTYCTSTLYTLALPKTEREEDEASFVLGLFCYFDVRNKTLAVTSLECQKMNLLSIGPSFLCLF